MAALALLKAAGAWLLRLPWQIWIVLLVAALLWASYLRGVNVERGRWEARIEADAKAAREKEATDRAAVETQNAKDQKTIADLNAQLSQLKAHPPAAPAPRIVRVCDAAARVPSAQADAGGSAGGGGAGRPVPDADDPRRALLDLRAELLTFAAQCQAVRTGALAGKEQWPRD